MAAKESLEPTASDSRRPAGSLRQIVRRHFLIAALVPLVIVELSLLLLYLTLDTYLRSEWTSGLAGTVRDDLGLVVEDNADFLSAQLKEIEHATAVMQDQAREVLLAPQPAIPTGAPPQFEVADNGVFYKQNNDGGSSVFYSATTPIGEAERDKATRTEALDPLFHRLVQDNPNIVAAYFNTHDNMSRYYPFIPDVYEQFDPDVQIDGFAFYYEADAKHDPERTVTWTDAYLDPAGQGWMVSSIAPVYRDSKLEGVVGLDVTIARVAENMLDLGLPWVHGSVLINESGAILAMNPEGERLLGLHELTEHRYTDIVESEQLKPDVYNLSRLEDPTVATGVADSLKQGAAIEVELDQRRFFLRAAPIETTGWRLAVLLDRDAVLAPVTAIHAQTRRVGLITFGLVAALAAGLTLLQLRSSRRLADRVASPLANLIDHTRSSTGGVAWTESRIDEVDRLSRNFARMVGELQSQIETRSAELSQVLTRLATEGQAPIELRCGELIDGRYRVQSIIGEGAMGRVYGVTRDADDEPLALKVLRDSGGSLELARLAREGHLAAKIRSPHVVRLYDMRVTERGFMYLVMERVDGGSLGEKRARYGDVAWATDIIQQLGVGLSAIHACGVIHRDLKPTNVLLARRGDDVVAKISDFGISAAKPEDTAPESETSPEQPVVPGNARSTDPDQPVVVPRDKPSERTTARVEAPAIWWDSDMFEGPGLALTSAGMVMGTPIYMAPEAALGASNAGSAADIFSLGVIAFELLTRELPFDQPPLTSQSSLTTPERRAFLKSLCPEAPEPLASLVEASLSLDPADRPTAKDFARLPAKHKQTGQSPVS